MPNLELLERREMQSLSKRRVVTALCRKYLVNLDGIRIDCPFRLESMAFDIPRLNSKNECTFKPPLARRNLMKRSSISVMTKLGNAIPNIFY